MKLVQSTTTMQSLSRDGNLVHVDGGVPISETMLLKLSRVLEILRFASRSARTVLDAWVGHMI